MDAFEVARKRAVALSEQLVQAGADPLSPDALVQGALEVRGIECIELPEGDPALKGARALFDEQTRTVLLEQTEDPAQRALLAAHELAHAELHTGPSTCDSNDIDASRSVEQVPVGIQRVEDYGARERRELQANVFAREFLLPRPRARALYLEDARTAGEIAETTGLPKALVFQQLLDALLLPEAIEAPESPSTTPKPPDSSQKEAAEHQGSAFLLQAGPGTGKTRTLIERAKMLLERGADPASLLLLTFSNRAAAELFERLTDISPEAAGKAFVSTFHAFGLDLVRRFHDRLELPPSPSLFDRSDAIAVLEEILPTLPLTHYRDLWNPARILRDVIGAISRAKDELATPERYLRLAAAMREEASDEDSNVAAEKCQEVAAVYQIYEEAKRKLGAVDFGDLIMLPTFLLEEAPELRKAVQLRHRHVLVDEYQDVNHASTRLLRALAGEGERLWVVGDARQSIYRFRGASSENVARFSEEYERNATSQLALNYRSTEQIVDALCGIAPKMSASQGMLPLELASKRGTGPAPIRSYSYSTPHAEAHGVADQIDELKRDGIAFRDQAVLCRTNRRLEEVAEVLEERGIPVLHLGSLFEREEVRDLLSVLSLLADPYGDALVRVGALAPYRLALQDVYAATQHLRSLESSPGTPLEEIAAADGLSEAGRAACAKLASDLAGFGSASQPWDVLATYVLDRTELGRRLASAESIGARIRAVAIWQLLNFVREPVRGQGSPIHKVLDRVRNLVLLAEERDLRQVPGSALHLDAVRLMTVHASKGLEFEAVHLPGLTKQSFPVQFQGQRCPPPVGLFKAHTNLTTKEAARLFHDEEEECLFFVAVSRARTHLCLSRSTLQPSGKRRSASPFVDWVTGRLCREVAGLESSERSAPPPLRRIDLTLRDDWELSHHRFVLYERCPRRFFYTHVLSLGARRKTGAFIQTHACLQDLIEWLGEARKDGTPTLGETEASLERIWQELGPTTHAYAEQYRELATKIVGKLHAAGGSRTFRIPEPLAVHLESGTVTVLPDELSELEDGTVILRRVRTGHKRSREYEDHLEYALYLFAAGEHFGTGARVEALHLTDGAEDSVGLSPRVLENRRKKSESILSGISGGHFPTQREQIPCAGCAHFFYCPATPEGPLSVS